MIPLARWQMCSVVAFAHWLMRGRVFCAIIAGKVLWCILYTEEGESVRASEAECCQIFLAKRVPMGLSVT